MSLEAVPNLNRMKNPASTGAFDQSEFVPENYSEVPWDTVLTRALYAFPNIFGMPRGMVTHAFEEWCKSVLQRRHPFLCCSAARAIFEGRLPGVPRPTNHFRSNKNMQQLITLLDIFETLVVEYMKRGYDGKDTEGKPGSNSGGSSGTEGTGTSGSEGEAVVSRSEATVDEGAHGNARRGRRSSRVVGGKSTGGK